MICKTKSGYKVFSHKSGRNFGTYKSKKEAEQRLREIKYFGSINKS